MKLKKIPVYILRKLLCIAAIAGYVLLCTNMARAQKYTFTHYDIENGLIQSQVNKVYQDNSHRLWIGTLGGACRFDGVNYFTISKSAGLINNFVYSIFCDKKGTVWFGTNKGLACFKNQKLYNFPIPAGIKTGWITHLVEDASGIIWGIIDKHLFKVAGNRMVVINDLPGNYVTTVAINKQGKLYAAVRGKGIYTLSGKVWESVADLPAPISKIFVVKLLFDRQQPDKIFIQTYKDIFVAQNSKVSLYAAELLKNTRRPFFSTELDAANNLWIGTGSGAYCLNHDKLIRFEAANGFSDAAVSDIYNDRDNNLWLATQGNGIFKYDGDDYVIYNRSDNVRENPIVMGIAHDTKQRILLAIDGGGVGVYDGKTISGLLLPAAMPGTSKVQCLYTDSTGNVWAGTNMGGIWKYDGKRFNFIMAVENNSINAITEAADGTIWLGTPTGIYYYDKQKMIRAAGISTFTSSLLMLGKDSLLLGTQEGVQLLINKKPVKNFKLKLLGPSAILCMIKYKNFIILGTDDEGAYIWNRQTGQVRNFQVKDGFKANSIYSLAVDDHQTIWAGTGRGVNRFTVNEQNMDCAMISCGESNDRIVESNQNAILYHDHKMLVGTTKGLAVYHTAWPARPLSAPYMIINSIKLLAADNSKAKILPNPAPGDRITLSSAQNHLSISFLGVYLKNPDRVSYQYRLTGLDDKFCSPVQNNVVDYPSLPPGRYTFEVKSISVDGQPSTNTASFSFEITPPFYRTYLFQLGVILFLIFFGVLLQRFFHQRKIQQQSALENMKREEKLKIRQQTAEDFHDDLGNKLTRITVLSDILDARLDQDKTEQKKLVLQIKQNAAALYNGTRDILWAMDPKSDNLFEVLNHIKETGIEIFQDTPVAFRFEGISSEQAAIKLPMEYSRNITMIFKELLNNALKHADPKNVIITYSLTDKEEACLHIADDGSGFNADLVNRGHGLNNVKARAKRIGAQLTFVTGKETGTSVELLFSIYKKA